MQDKLALVVQTIANLRNADTDGMVNFNLQVVLPISILLSGVVCFIEYLLHGY